MEGDAIDLVSEPTNANDPMEFSVTFEAIGEGANDMDEDEEPQSSQQLN